MKGRELEAWGTKAVLALVGVVFLTVFPYQSGVNNPNENVRTFMTMAIVEHGTLRIDEIVQRHGWINDMAKVEDSEGFEHFYSVKGPAVSYAGVPFYWAFVRIEALFGASPPSFDDPPDAKADWLRRATFVMRFFTVQLPLFVFLIWFERFLRRVTPDVVLRLVTVVAAGLGTNYLAYAQMYASHAAFACAAFLGFALTMLARIDHEDPEARPVRAAFFAGFFTGLATLLEYHGLVVSAVLAVYGLSTFHRRKQLVALAAGGAIDVAVLMLFQWRAFGNPLTPGHRMLENTSYKAFHDRGFFGIEPPNAKQAMELLFSPTFGFFGTAPFMWLAFLVVPAAIFWLRGSARLRREQRIAVLVGFVAMTALVIAVSGAVVWRGGWTVGPRLLGAAPPFVATAAVFAIERLARRRSFLRSPLRGAAGGLACAGAIDIGLVGLVYNTIPEELLRPLPELALPFAAAGFAPWHLGDFVGWHGPGFFRLVVVCLALAGLLATFLPSRDGLYGIAIRAALAAPLFSLALRPALALPSPEEPFFTRDYGLERRRDFARTWEPLTSNPFVTLTVRAGREGRPCLYGELAHVELLLGFTEDAREHAARSEGQPRCP